MAENNPQDLTTHQIAAEMLAGDGYSGYTAQQRYEMMQKLGPSVLPALVEVEDV